MGFRSSVRLQNRCPLYVVLGTHVLYRDSPLRHLFQMRHLERDVSPPTNTCNSLAPICASHGPHEVMVITQFHFTKGVSWDRGKCIVA